MSEGRATLQPRGETRAQRGHPWIFRSDVAKVEGASPGAVVAVEGPRGRPLGFAFYSSRSEIRLRMISRAEALPETFLHDRLAAAVAWREVVAHGAEAYRLVHGEGDGLPSLIVDRYGPYLVVQTLSQATERHKPEILRSLQELLQPRGVLERNDPRVRELEGLERRVSLLHGEVPEEVDVREGNVTLRADLWKGQKTGLFLDQRENHLRAREYSRGRVLDAFAYDGGFALQMASTASEVLAIDVSSAAVERIRANAQRNRITNITAQEGNVFDVLRDLETQGRRFDTIVLDPPAFAKSRDAVPGARRGYKEINLRALKLLSPGGTLVTCSCSYHVHEDDLQTILEEAAMDAGVPATIVEKRSQSRDHPVLLGVPETYYLKCFVLRRLP